MVLKGISINNFRTFGANRNPAEFEFAPITILTGPNNSGKSSLMKHLTIGFLIIISFLTPKQIQAQNVTDSIRVEYSFWGNSFYRGEKEYSKSEIKEVLNNNPNSHKMIDAYDNSKTWGYILLGAGLFFTGNSIYSAWETSNNYGQPPFSDFEYRGYSYSSTKFWISSVLAVGLDLTGIWLLLNNNKFYKAIGAFNKKPTTSNLKYKIYLDNERICFIVSIN